MRSARTKSIIITTILAVIAISTEAKKTPTQSDRGVEVETTITAVSAAELIISDDRVSLSTSWGPKIISPTNLEQRKENLIVELCRKVGADVLVDPQFTYTRRILGGGRLSVSGYPAKYKNFRSMTDKEIDKFITSPEYNTGKVVFINK